MYLVWKGSYWDAFGYVWARVGDTYVCASCGYHWDNYGKSYSSDWKPDKESLWNKIKKFFRKLK